MQCDDFIEQFHPALMPNSIKGASLWKKISGLRLGLPVQILIVDPRNIWCRRGESNPRPRDYETLALPLSYAGTVQFLHATDSPSNVSRHCSLEP